MPLRLLFITLLSTSLCTLSWAAPSSRTTLDPSPYLDESDPMLSQEGRGGMPAADRHSLFVGAGYGSGSYLNPDEYLNSFTFILRYAAIDYKELPAWDYQLEINSENLLGLSIGRRWYCCPDDSFVPYGRLAVGTFMDGFSELGGLIDLERWRVRSSVGIGHRWNAEAGVGYALAGYDLYIQCGYTFQF